VARCRRTVYGLHHHHHPLTLPSQLQVFPIWMDGWIDRWVRRQTHSTTDPLRCVLTTLPTYPTLPR